MLPEKLKVIWEPQPGPQHAYVQCPAEEIFLGGARGGGKTDAVLGKWAIQAFEYGKYFNAIMFRRSMISADDAIERSKQIYEPLGGYYNHSYRSWRFARHTAAGARIRFRYLDTIRDAEHYQGQNVSHAWVEEVGQYATPAPIDRIQGAMRSAERVPVQLTLTGNPGGAGQHWLRERYKLHPLPAHPLTFLREIEGGKPVRVAVIPARVQDNQVLMHSDPGYVERLKRVGDSKLVRAWLDGDWSAVEGAFFEDWSESRHVIEPFSIPDEWTKIVAFDWGSAAPFSVGWWAVPLDDHQGIPRGAMVRYREWYGAKEANVGLKLTAEEVGDGIRQRQSERIDLYVADPSIFAQDGGPSIAERTKLPWTPADNRRIPGWDQVRARLRNDMLFVFSPCSDLIRTIPVLQHDSVRMEDLDTHAEDHAADEMRYACMVRPYSGKLIHHKPDDDEDIPTAKLRLRVTARKLNEMRR